MSNIQRGLPGELRAARASSATRSALAGLGSLPPGLAARLAGAVHHAPESAAAVARMEVDPLARATLLAGMAERVLAAWLAQPLAGGASLPGGIVMLHLAVEIDTDAATMSAQAGTARGIRVMQIGAGSPQATAWQAGYLDGRAGRVPRFTGPGELEGDYWRGMDAALSHGGA
ncbi:hypothetical protein [Roseomonas sp. WA12]